MDYAAFAIGVAVGGLVIGLLMMVRSIGARARYEAEMKAARETLPTTFKAMAAEALSQNNQSFLHLANESLKTQVTQAQGDLELKKQAVEALVKPIKETLDGMERERQNAYGGLKAITESLSRETRNLTQALKEPQVRGRWGETTLRRTVELAGLVERCDFFEQVSTQAGDDTLRPDMVICLPNNRKIVVDAKTPLPAYMQAVEAQDDETRSAALKLHARHVRDHYQKLSAKAYWAALNCSPEFVVLFLPGEQFLTAALREDPELMDDAMQKKIVLATPATLFSLLNAVKYGWREEQLTENAVRIGQLGKELFERISVWSAHLGRMGDSLEKAVAAYNNGMGSLERNVMPSARRLKELGISTDKDLAELEPVESSVRPPPPGDAGEAA
jgi:DNA recombination protein RmuC